jgi:hypothetical protein
MNVLTAFGLVIVVAGLLILLLRPGTPGGSFKLPGMQFEFKVAGLVVMAFGIILVSMGQKSALNDGDIIATVSPTSSATSTGSPRPPTQPPATTNPPTDEPVSGTVIKGPWSQTVNGLTVTVLEVHVDASSLELLAEVKNRTSDDISLPVYGNLTAVDNLSNNYEADSFTSEWPRQFAAGSTTRGTIRFETGPKPGAQFLDIKFTTVYGTFKVKSISVTHIRLR